VAPVTSFTRSKATTSLNADVYVSESPSPNYAHRLQVTAEVLVSKIFPAGFGWQYASGIAESMGFAANDLGFFAMTGFGDLCGVFLGHSIFYAAKSLVSPDVKMSNELCTGWFLASAAFCSGFAWQPTVNLLQAASLPWIGVAGGTWVVCGAAFYGGLRLGRVGYGSLGMVDGPSYDNVKTDASLSVAIGGATGAFVGTDAAYLPLENPLVNVVGITEADSVLAGCAKAGSSTFIGFAAAQAPQVALYPASKNWTD